MASSIDFGSLTTKNSAPRLAGTSSGLDTEALLTAMVDAKRLPALRLEASISENEAKIAAFGDLRNLLADLRTSLSSLRNPPGFLGGQENAFERKGAYFSSNTATSPTDLLGISVDNEAQVGSFELTVDQVASARKFAGDSVIAADQALAEAYNGGVAFSGSFTIGSDGGPAVSVAVDGTMDVYDLRAAINGANAGVTASVLKVADDDYRLVVTADDTGKEIIITAESGDDVLALTGLSSDGGASFKNPVQEPLPALFSIDGVALTRTDNKISDALDGLTISLFKAEPGTTVTVDVERDLNEVKTQIVDFVSAFNAFRDFVALNREIDDSGTIDEGAVLFGNSLLRGVNQAVGQAITNSVAGLPAGAVSTLAQIGITLGSDNHLTIDEAKLDQILLTDVDGVRDVFEFHFTASSENLKVLARSDALSDTAFSVNIVDADADGIIDSADIDGVAVAVEGHVIRGLAGTAYEGLELFWSGQGSTSIEVTATQGIADRLYNQLDATLDEFEGSIATEIDNLGQLNDSARSGITRIEERAEDYRLQLITKFTAMEAALSLAKSMLDQIRMTTDAMFADS